MGGRRRLRSSLREEDEDEDEQEEDDDEEEEEEEEVWLVQPDADQPDVVALHTRGRCASRCSSPATYCDTDAPDHESVSEGLSCSSDVEEWDDSDEGGDW